jgi:hypothetical protein
MTALAIVLSVLVVVVFACSQAKSNLPVPKWLATHTDAREYFSRALVAFEEIGANPDAVRTCEALRSLD